MSLPALIICLVMHRSQLQPLRLDLDGSHQHHFPVHSRMQEGTDRKGTDREGETERDKREGTNRKGKTGKERQEGSDRRKRHRKEETEGKGKTGSGTQEVADVGGGPT